MPCFTCTPHQFLLCPLHIQNTLIFVAKQDRPLLIQVILWGVAIRDLSNVLDGCRKAHRCGQSITVSTLSQSCLSIGWTSRVAYRYIDQCNSTVPHRCGEHEKGCILRQSPANMDIGSVGQILEEWEELLIQYSSWMMKLSGRMCNACQWDHQTGMWSGCVVLASVITSQQM